MGVTPERTIEDLYREQALGLLRFALLLTGDLATAEDLKVRPDGGKTFAAADANKQ